MACTETVSRVVLTRKVFLCSWVCIQAVIWTDLVSLCIFCALLFALTFYHMLYHPWSGVSVVMESRQEEGEDFAASLQNHFCLLAGLNSTRWREQSCRVQCCWAHQGRCESGLPKCTRQWPFWPQLAQNCPQHSVKGCLTLHRLQTGADAAYWRQGKYWHSRKDCDWQTLVW